MVRALLLCGILTGGKWFLGPASTKVTCARKMRNACTLSMFAQQAAGFLHSLIIHSASAHAACPNQHAVACSSTGNMHCGFSLGNLKERRRCTRLFKAYRTSCFFQENFATEEVVWWWSSSSSTASRWGYYLRAVSVRRVQRLCRLAFVLVLG